MSRKILAVDFADAFCEINYQDTSKRGIEFSDHMNVKFEIFEWVSSISDMCSTVMLMVVFICRGRRDNDNDSEKRQRQRQSRDNDRQRQWIFFELATTTRQRQQKLKTWSRRHWFVVVGRQWTDNRNFIVLVQLSVATFFCRCRFVVCRSV